LRITRVQIRRDPSPPTGLWTGGGEIALDLLAPCFRNGKSPSHLLPDFASPPKLKSCALRMQSARPPKTKPNKRRLTPRITPSSKCTCPRYPSCLLLECLFTDAVVLHLMACSSHLFWFPTLRANRASRRHASPVLISPPTKRAPRSRPSRPGPSRSILAFTAYRFFAAEVRLPTKGISLRRCENCSCLRRWCAPLAPRLSAHNQSH